MTNKYLVACLVLLGSVLAQPTLAQSEPNQIQCTLQKSGAEFKGSCSVPCLVNALAINIDGPNKSKKVICDTPLRQVNVMLRKVEQRDGWLGTMEGKEPEDPTRFALIEGHNGAPGIAKTPFGWFALLSFRKDVDTLDLTITANKQLPPTKDDIRIIQRALELVVDEKVWNRNDNRKCPPNPQKWSVYCALMQATQEVSGGVHYRQPAFQAVREVLNEVGGNRLNKHRLMDYNNHPDTTLEDIHNLLRKAQARLEKRLSE
jgi:hypothetical protein